MSHEAALRDIAGKLPVRPNARMRQVWIAFMVIGVAAFAFLFYTNPLRAWGSWTINTLYFLGIAMGGIALACAIRLANGRWGGPIMRIGESLSAYLPFGLVTMLILLAGGSWTYLPWIKHVEPRQAPFLNVPFLWIRTLGGLALFTFLARKLVYTSLRADLQALKPFVAPELKAAYEKGTANWKGDQAEKDWYRHESAHLAPQLALLFVVSFTVMAWDFIMALTPNWVSGLFGWWVYAGAFITAVATTCVIAVNTREKYSLQAYITTNMFWDIGKVLFAWCVFWGYLFWSQYLPIWYANMPEETWWVFLRFEEPWRSVSFIVFSLVFVIPFLGMLNKTSKTNPTLLTTFSIIALVGIWLERHVLVMPSLDAEKVWIGLPEVGVTLGFLGLFGWAVQGFLSKYPVVRVADVLDGAGGHGH
jgi:Ni/Fe-hydrogenase subunit HybB-like protein